MRTLLLLASVTLAACSGLPPDCNVRSCTVPTDSNSCNCGARFCTACLCDVPGCELTDRRGTVHAVDCADMSAVVACGLDGGL